MASSDRGCADRDSMPCKTLVWSAQNKQGNRSCISPLKQSDAQQEQRAGQGMGHWQVEGQGERQRKGKGKGKHRARQKAQQWEQPGGKPDRVSSRHGNHDEGLSGTP